VSCDLRGTTRGHPAAIDSGALIVVWAWNVFDCFIPSLQHSSVLFVQTQLLYSYCCFIATMGYQVGNIYVIAAVAVVGGGLFGTLHLVQASIDAPAADRFDLGFDISSMSAILGTQAYKCYFNQGHTIDGNCQGPHAGTQGGITAAMPAGSWVGSILSGFLSDRFGRKKSIMIGCVIWVIGSTIICASQDIGMLIAGRVINGFCVGIESAQVPVYISEIAPPTKRGRLVAFQQWAITWGILILYYISYGASFVGGSTPHTYSKLIVRTPETSKRLADGFRGHGRVQNPMGNTDGPCRTLVHRNDLSTRESSMAGSVRVASPPCE